MLSRIFNLIIVVIHRGVIMIQKIFSVLLLCLLPLYAQGTKLSMPSIFGSNMVLQQNARVKLWGTAKPNAEVTIAASWNEISSTRADSTGNWRALVKTKASREPQKLNIRSAGETIIFQNILLGEVWLCSGQSNMEMTIADWKQHAPAGEVIALNESGALPLVRLFTVRKALSHQPERNCEGEWVACTAADLQKFSAVGYFFGKEINSQTGYPVGLIHASWGGTPVEAWMSNAAAGKFPVYQPVIDLLDKYKESFTQQRKWRNTHPVLDIIQKSALGKWKDLSFADEACAGAGFADNAWMEMRLPCRWEETKFGNFDGAVWFRKKVRIPPNWAGKDLQLVLGPIDDMDRTFVNGVLVGITEENDAWNKPRVYPVSGTLVEGDSLCIAVRVIDPGAGGGIYSDKGGMYLQLSGGTEQLQIDGDWKFLPVAEFLADRFYVYGGDAKTNAARPATPFTIHSATPGALFNGMIAPVLPFTLQGVIWYQGEANVDNPELYCETFPAMIADWRRAFENRLMPFYFVQIAPFNYGPATESQFLREAQMKAMQLKKTGMAVTLDIGDTVNIHPANKTTVGKRLAYWALRRVYGKKLPYTGPVYKSKSLEGNRMVLSFSHTQSGLLFKPVSGLSGFTIAGEDKIFHDAHVEIIGQQVIVSHPAVPKPAAVRYCWSNTGAATLYNGDGFPASSFRTDSWRRGK